MRQVSLLVGFLVIISVQASAQSALSSDLDTAYHATIEQRAAKIVAKLLLNDPAKSKAVTEIVARQYLDLNDIQSTRDSLIHVAKANNPAKGADYVALVEAAEETARAKTTQLHTSFIRALGKYLNPRQVDEIKDGMTYGVLPITFKAYHDMLPNLTAEQSKQIMTWLIEARELAMDAESSDKKHAMFGKYKGRINNYLSAAGYDLKKEGADWEKRRKAAAVSAK